MPVARVNKRYFEIKKYLTYFYIVCMLVLAGVCVPFVALYLFIKPDKGGKR